MDMCATFSGLKLGFIYELNPVMNALYQADPILFAAVKLSFSLILVALVINVPIKINVFLRWATAAACILYTLILGMHSLWIYHAVS
nr:DUF5658 family protein [Metabacillus kandeliae]